MRLAKLGRGMLSSVEQAFVGRDEKRAPLKTPAWEARAARNRWAMMTFLLFAPASMKWLGRRKDRTSPRDRLGRFCDIYCAFILRDSFALRVISDILWSSCFSESYGPKF